MTMFATSPEFGVSLPLWIDKARAWGIEYGGFRSNHLAHNWIVISAAGAGDDRMQWWLDLYTGRLDTQHARNVDHHPEPARVPEPGTRLDDDSWRAQVVNASMHYPKFLGFFDEKVGELGIERALKRYLPPLLPGLAGAALHPIIHTGWAVEAGHPGMVAEGLAYMAVAYEPLTNGPTPDPLWAPGGPQPIDASLTFLTAADADSLSDIAMEQSLTARYQEHGRGGFQHRIKTFSDPNLPIGSALDAAAPIGLPGLGEALDETIDELTALMTAAYLGSNCEFFVIHGVTSLHAVLVLLEYLEPVDQRAALAYWWRAAMATVVVQGLPGLAATVETISQWSTRVDPEPHEDSEDDEWWLDQLNASLVSRDEHVPKALYCLWRWTHLSGASAASRALFRRAAENQMRRSSTGELHDNIWMAFENDGTPMSDATNP